jgi:hypothetical protein
MDNRNSNYVKYKDPDTGQIFIKFVDPNSGEVFYRPSSTSNPTIPNIYPPVSDINRSISNASTFPKYNTPKWMVDRSKTNDSKLNTTPVSKFVTANTSTFSTNESKSNMPIMSKYRDSKIEINDNKILDEDIIQTRTKIETINSIKYLIKVGIEPAIKELNCCCNDIQKINSNNNDHKKYLNILLFNFNNFKKQIDEIPKLTACNPQYNIHQIKDKFYTELRPIITALFVGYYNFLIQFKHDIEIYHSMVYTISPEFKRSELGICDIEVSPSSSIKLFASQKLRIILSMLSIFNQNLDILSKGPYFNDFGLVEDSKVLESNCENYLDGINNIWKVIENWNKNGYKETFDGPELYNNNAQIELNLDNKDNNNPIFSKSKSKYFRIIN